MLQLLMKHALARAQQQGCFATAEVAKVCCRSCNLLPDYVWLQHQGCVCWNEEPL